MEMAEPIIYAFEDSRYPGWLKVGMTNGRSPEKRVREQYATVIPYGELPYRIVLTEKAVKHDGTFFDDHLVHYLLSARGFERGYSEWFRCNIPDVEKAVEDIRNGIDINKIIEEGIKDGRIKKDQG